MTSVSLTSAHLVTRKSQYATALGDSQSGGRHRDVDSDFDTSRGFSSSLPIPVSIFLRNVSRNLATSEQRASAILIAGLVFLALWSALRLRTAVLERVVASQTCAMPPEWVPAEGDVFANVQDFPKIDLALPMVVKYLRLIHKYLEPWSPIPGIPSGLGHRGFITRAALERVTRMPSVMSCSGHVRVIDRKVYFRYGGFWHVYYRIDRFLQTVKMIQDAIDEYDLSGLRLEMVINTCDHPMSFYSSHWPDRAGLPIMSPGFTVDTMDIPIPDPLDLTKEYTPDLRTQIPWEKKQARAVFRGKTTNFLLENGNWGANPRIRLHRISDALPTLMDAHINAWSHASGKVVAEMEADGLALAPRMNFTQFNAFKYQVIVDGGGGSCRTCGVLRSNQLSIRQETPLLQFYEPLLEDNVHWLMTTRTFSDLPQKVRWAQEHDEAVQRMVRASNGFAAYACTWSGRRLYWALMLLKYQVAMAEPEAVEEPTAQQLCKDPPIVKAIPKSQSPHALCTSPDVDQQQPKCAFFCIRGTIPADRFIWLKSDVLKNLEKVGPP